MKKKHNKFYIHTNKGIEELPNQNCIYYKLERYLKFSFYKTKNFLKAHDNITMTLYILLSIAFTLFLICLASGLLEEMEVDSFKNPLGAFTFTSPTGLDLEESSVTGLTTNYMPTPSPIFYITGYSEKDSCHYENCLMANGLPAQYGYVACPRYLPLGTKIQIEGLGEFICGDRYSKYLSERFDVWFGYGEKNYRRAVNWGVRQLPVKIIN